MHSLSGEGVGKYYSLTQYLIGLNSTQTEVALSFDEIQSILAQGLPASAREHRPWWANQKDNSTRPQAKAWMDAGFEARDVDLVRGRVRFVRTRITPTDASTDPEVTPSASPTGGTDGIWLGMLHNYCNVLRLTRQPRVPTSAATRNRLHSIACVSSLSSNTRRS